MYQVDGRPRAGIITKQHLNEGDELTIDYGWILDSSTVQQECSCGSNKCRKVLYKPTAMKDVALSGGISNYQKVTCYFATSLQLLVQGLYSMPNSLFEADNENAALNPLDKEIDEKLQSKLKKAILLLREGKNVLIKVIIPQLMKADDDKTHFVFECEDCGAALLRMVETFWPSLLFFMTKNYSGGVSADNVAVNIKAEAEIVHTVKVTSYIGDDGILSMPLTMSEGINTVFEPKAVPQDWNLVQDFLVRPMQQYTMDCPKKFLI